MGINIKQAFCLGIPVHRTEYCYSGSHRPQHYYHAANVLYRLRASGKSHTYTALKIRKKGIIFALRRDEYSVRCNYPGFAMGKYS